MRLSLQGLLLADTVPTDPYFKVLKERLQKAGIDLLNVVRKTKFYFKFEPLKLNE